MGDTWGWPILLGVLGAVFGSFIAVIVVRWPEGRLATQGRSACDGCGRTLTAIELVPVLSYLIQRGRCRGCSARIDPALLLIELLGAAIGVTAGVVAPGLEGVAGAVFGWLLLALAGLDLTALWLPNLLTGALAFAGLSGWALGIEPDLESRLIGGIAGFGVLWLVATGYRTIRGREGLGGGDPKLFGAIGLWLGWQPLPIVLLAACLIGLSAVLGLRLGGHRLPSAAKLPLGAMLAAAAWAAWLGGAVTPPPEVHGVVIVEPAD